LRMLMLLQSQGFVSQLEDTHRSITDRTGTKKCPAVSGLEHMPRGRALRVHAVVGGSNPSRSILFTI